MIKNFQQTRNRRQLPQFAKGHPNVNIILNSERLNALPLELGIGQDVHSYHFYSTLY